MRRSSSAGPRCRSWLVVLAALGLLGAVPAAAVGKGGTATYEYKVTRVDYAATAQLSAGNFKGLCNVGNALWEGDVATAPSELALLGSKLGKASLHIHSHGTSGTLDANELVVSKLTNAFHRETTACDASDSEVSAAETPCSQTQDSTLHVHARIAGGVGTRVKLSWTFFLFAGASGKLVPDTFSCVEPYQFPDGSCVSRSTLNAFTGRSVKLRFKCDFATTTPPSGRSYTKYGAVATAAGTIRLQRTRFF